MLAGGQLLETGRTSALDIFIVSLTGSSSTGNNLPPDESKLFHLMAAHC